MKKVTSIQRVVKLVTRRSLNTKKQSLGIRPNRTVSGEGCCSDNLPTGLAPNDSDWARTSDLYPVKVALSQLSYGIDFARIVLSNTFIILACSLGSCKHTLKNKYFQLLLTGFVWVPYNNHRLVFIGIKERCSF